MQLPPHSEGSPKVRHIRLSAHEVVGRDADDFVRAPVESNGPTDERRVAAELPAPETLAQDNDRVCSRRDIVVRRQESSERRLTAKHAEIVSRNGQPEGELITRRNDAVVCSGPPGDGIAERNGERTERDDT